MLRSIVLTGGPGSGKTAVCAALAERHPGRFAVVPEAATQVYQLLQTRWDRLDTAGRCDVQMRIYRLQIEQEQRIARLYPGRTLLLDRGTVDGSAYWPFGAEDYWTRLGTSHSAEMARYDLVVWLECSAALGLYDGETSNPCRFEDPAGAISRGEMLFNVWQGHPNLHRVPACRSIEEKIAAVARLADAPTGR